MKGNVFTGSWGSDVTHLGEPLFCLSQARKQTVDGMFDCKEKEVKIMRNKVAGTMVLIQLRVLHLSYFGTSFLWSF